jgi:hypothetical protein
LEAVGAVEQNLREQNEKADFSAPNNSYRICGRVLHEAGTEAHARACASSNSCSSNYSRACANTHPTTADTTRR